MQQFGAWNRRAAAIFGLIAFCGLAGAAQAQGRPDTRALTCDQARSLVSQRGAAVLTTGRHTYDRFVANERFCSIGYTTRRAYVATTDAQSCPIGYTCILDTRDEDDWWRLRRP